jgi:hypothetical protein
MVLLVPIWRRAEATVVVVVFFFVFYIALARIRGTE